jgi:hypothetical protein
MMHNCEREFWFWIVGERDEGKFPPTSEQIELSAIIRLKEETDPCCMDGMLDN